MSSARKMQLAKITGPDRITFDFNFSPFFIYLLAGSYLYRVNFQLRYENVRMDLLLYYE